MVRMADVVGLWYHGMFRNYGFGSRVNWEQQLEAEKVAYMSGETVRCRSSRVPQPRFDWTETALEFNFICISEILAYFRTLIIGEILGKGNPQQSYQWRRA